MLSFFAEIEEDEVETYSFCDEEIVVLHRCVMYPHMTP